METVFGLIGKTLTHSFSAAYFNNKFARENISARYDLYPINSIDKIQDLILNNTSLKGLNVTIPYKEKIIPYLHSLSEAASRCGAVNVVRIDRTADGFSLYGDNTDIVGFRRSISPMLSKDHQKALVFGTGGASKAVCLALSKMGIGYTLVSRSPEKGDLTYDQIDRDLLLNHLILINATPLGTSPDVETAIAIPYRHLTSRHVAFDLVYNPSETRFLALCREAGATCKNGLEMLHIQADESWKIWNHE